MDAAVATEGRPSPADDGFHMPAEWAPHTQTWMGWPYRPDNWRDGGRPAQAAYARVAAAVAEFEPVTVCTNPGQAEAARAALHEGVRVVEVPQDDAWFRDTGPSMVVRGAGGGSGAVAGVDWDFNAWGGIYSPCSRDKEVARKILESEGLRRYPCPLVLEGGSIHVDGEGTLLTTEECLLNPNRNPGHGRAEIEAALRAMLGVTRVLWLPLGLVADDDTNGHVDNFACFARPGVVLLAWTDDEGDPQHAVSKQALEILEGSVDAKGRALQVIKLPCPPNLHRTAEEAAGVAAAPGTKPRCAGERLAASYVNFYLCNGGLVMPAFGVPEADGRAQRVLEAAFPGRRVVAVQTREILLGGGNIHCITQQQPAAGGGG